MKISPFLTEVDLPKPIHYWQNELKPYLGKIGGDQYNYYRDIHLQFYGFPIITMELCHRLSTWIGKRTVFEVGAGIGYLARVLSELGVNVFAVDDRSGKYQDIDWWSGYLWYDVKNESHSVYGTFPDEIVMMSWPDHGTSLAYDVALKMKSDQILVFQGMYRGFTGTQAFFDYIEENFCLIEDITHALNEVSCSFPGFNDRWFIFKKK